MTSQTPNRETASTEGIQDLISKHLDVLFCGINPALSAAKSGHHFSNRSNRFWKVLHMAGFTPNVIVPENDASILEYGCGLTAAVARPTVRASELAKHEFHAAAKELEHRVQLYRPRFLAFLGKPAFAALLHKTSVEWGRQAMTFGGSEVCVLPNPSGLNRAFSLAQLVEAYRQLRVASQKANEPSGCKPATRSVSSP
jgi:double-stranded uracil-DNA glycosylase